MLHATQSSHTVCVSYKEQAQTFNSKPNENSHFSSNSHSLVKGVTHVFLKLTSENASSIYKYKLKAAKILWIQSKQIETTKII